MSRTAAEHRSIGDIKPLLEHEPPLAPPPPLVVVPRRFATLAAIQHLTVPTGWVSVVGLPDVELEVVLIRAYHRHAADFCGRFPERLKTRSPLCDADRGDLRLASAARRADAI